MVELQKLTEANPSNNIASLEAVSQKGHPGSTYFSRVDKSVSATAIVAHMEYIDHNRSIG
jgi:hypothetical protein